MSEIRRADAGDLEALLPLVRGYREFYGQVGNEDGERRTIRAHLRDGTSAIYVATEGDRLVGFAQMFSYVSTVWLRPTWILEDLFVERAARGGGVAAALLGRAVEHVRESGGAGLFLETAIDNETAQRVYERCGWVREGHFLKYNAPL
jgi:GNAT superfamily N-acetyltransferase